MVAAVFHLLRYGYLLLVVRTGLQFEDLTELPNVQLLVDCLAVYPLDVLVILNQVDLVQPFMSSQVGWMSCHQKPMVLSISCHGTYGATQVSLRQIIDELTGSRVCGAFRGGPFHLDLC